jgi:hypothetical protein
MRIVGVTGAVLFLVLLLVYPAGAVPFANQQPRPTATAAPYLALDPTVGVSGAATPVVGTGALWVPGRPVVLYWDDPGAPLGTATPGADGTFQINFTTPTQAPYSNIGFHTVHAEQGPLAATAAFELIAATPTNTLTPSNTPPNTLTPTNTPTNTPVTPTPTGSATPTFTPSPTLRPVTPMVTITPFPPTKPPPGPARTNTPRPTRTDTPVPGTPTVTHTPSITPTPSDTPAPGTPSVTPEPSATPVEEISDTGAGWGTIFLWGFVLAGLLVVFRLLRVRSLPGQS